MSVTFYFPSCELFSRDREAAKTRASFELDDSRAVRAQELKKVAVGAPGRPFEVAKGVFSAPALDILPGKKLQLGK